MVLVPILGLLLNLYIILFWWGAWWESEVICTIAWLSVLPFFTGSAVLHWIALGNCAVSWVLLLVQIILGLFSIILMFVGIGWLLWFVMGIIYVVEVCQGFLSPLLSLIGCVVIFLPQDDAPQQVIVVQQAVAQPRPAATIMIQQPM